MSVISKKIGKENCLNHFNIFLLRKKEKKNKKILIKNDFSTGGIISIIK